MKYLSSRRNSKTTARTVVVVTDMEVKEEVSEGGKAGEADKNCSRPI